MRAAVLTNHGDLDNLVVRDDVPQPTPGPGELLIRVSACGINNTDVWTREGAYGTGGRRTGWQGKPLDFPRIQGADPVGEVVGVGDGVPDARVGERVLVNPVIYGSNGDDLHDVTLLGSERDGGFAEFVTVPAENAHAVESELTDAELATFATAALTAEHMLNRAALADGETVLVTGASGGVGGFLVQLAKLRGARVIAVTSRVDAVRALGADVVIPRGDGHIADAAGEGVDVVADVVGGPLFADVLAALAPGGRYVTAGAIAGVHVDLDLRTLYLKHLTFLGSSIGTRDEFATLVDHVRHGRLRPILGATYPLERIREAQEAFLQKEHAGKIVIVP